MIHLKNLFQKLSQRWLPPPENKTSSTKTSQPPPQKGFEKVWEELQPEVKKVFDLTSEDFSKQLQNNSSLVYYHQQEQIYLGILEILDKYPLLQETYKNKAKPLAEALKKYELTKSYTGLPSLKVFGSFNKYPKELVESFLKAKFPDIKGKLTLDEVYEQVERLNPKIKKRTWEDHLKNFIKGSKFENDERHIVLPSPMFNKNTYYSQELVKAFEEYIQTKNSEKPQTLTDAKTKILKTLKDGGLDHLPPQLAVSVLSVAGLLPPELNDQQLVELPSISAVLDPEEKKPTDTNNKKIESILKALKANSLLNLDEAKKFLEQCLINSLWEKVVEGEKACKGEETIQEILKKRNELYMPFQEELRATQKIKDDCSILNLNWAQALVMHRFQQNPITLAFLPPGSGKTYAAILATEGKAGETTFLITNKSTLFGWEESIRRCYPNANIINLNSKKSFDLSEIQHNFLLINFEAFSGSERIPNIAESLKGIINNIILDEAHLVKSEADQVRRVRTIQETVIPSDEDGADKIQEVREEDLAEIANNNQKILAMTATPCINNIKEGINLIETLTKKSLGFAGKNVLVDAMRLHSEFMRLGMVNLNPVPPIDHEIKHEEINLSGNEAQKLLDELTEIKKENLNPTARLAKTEQALIKAKLPYILSKVDEGKPLIIYSDYINGGQIIKLLQDSIDENKVGLYTSEDKSGLDKFINGEVQVLIATRPLKYGVDGLQKVPDVNMIIASLPPSYADFIQLIGRIIRQGISENHKPIIFIPQITSLNGIIFEWDFSKWLRVAAKEGLHRAVVYGIIPQSILADPNLFATIDKALYPRPRLTRIKDLLNISDCIV